MAEHQATDRRLISAQRNEITKHRTYRWLAARTREARNRDLLERAAEEELAHYRTLRRRTGIDVRPRPLQLVLWRLLARGLGLSFALRLMEGGSELTPALDGALDDDDAQLSQAVAEEERRADTVLSDLVEERLDYAGSIVLGLNDALVELTGALAGFTLALRDSRSIAMAGFVTGVAASMSMAASEFLSSREEAQGQDARSPAKAAVYTGVSYFVTVIALILPYVLFDGVYLSLSVMLGLSLAIILAYNLYISIAKGVGLLRRFATMAGISLGVAGISFLVGMAARQLFGVSL